MRDYMSNLMTVTFGSPSRSREGCDWWVFQNAAHPPVHVCLNAPCRPHLAHIIIFNPAASGNDCIVDVSAYTEPEAQQIIRQIQDIISRDGKMKR